LENAAPLFSAGITAFNIIHSENERLKHKFNRKLRVCIVGLGAVGHMAVKFANQYNY
jgi:D-arabinose 1-dehydrogenase-like Zn-dependent alcohol dehydrogenase